MFKLNYYISNGGDGSANLMLMPSEKEAEEACDSQSEGWGENSSGQIELRIVRGIIQYRTFERVDGKYATVWKPCEQ